MVGAVLALRRCQAHGLHLRLELVNAANAGKVTVQFGGHVTVLQQLLVEIEGGSQVLVTLQSVLLVVAVRRKDRSSQYVSLI